MYHKKSNAVGIVMIIMIIVVGYVIYQQGLITPYIQQANDFVRIFPDGVKMVIHGKPTLDNIISGDSLNSVGFTASTLNDYLKSQGRQVITPVVQQSSNKTASPINGSLSVQGVSKQTGSLINLPFTYDNGIPVYHRGGIVHVSGIITENNISGQYVYGVVVQCCDMSPYVAAQNILTDGNGNFDYPIATNQQFPLGLWSVTISHRTSTGQIDSYTWQMKLVD